MVSAHVCGLGIARPRVEASGEELIMKKSRSGSQPGRKLLLGVVAAACLLGAGATSIWAAGPDYTAWSAPANLGPTINTAVTETGPALSKNGLSLYFYSPRAGGVGGNDIWVSQRESANDAWGAPMNLGSMVNSALRA